MIAIPNVGKPQNCAECPMSALSEFSGIVCKLNRNNNKNNCPLIEIDHTNTELLEFFNEFKKWKASKEVAKYINAVYGERRAE